MSGNQQQAHTTYPNPAEFEPRVVGNYHGFNHQSSQVPGTSAMLLQPLVSGQNFGFFPSYLGEGSAQQSDQHMMMSRVATGVKQSNPWLRLIPTRPLGRHYDASPYRSIRNDHLVTDKSGAPASSYLPSYMSQNVIAGQYATLSQSPWSSDNTRTDRGGTMSDRNLNCNEICGTVSGMGRSRGGRSAKFGTDDCDSTTLVSSCNRDVGFTSGVHTLVSNTRGFDWEDMYTISGEAYTPRDIPGPGHGRQNECHHVKFRFNLREGTPQLNECFGNDKSSSGLRE